VIAVAQKAGRWQRLRFGHASGRPGLGQTPRTGRSQAVGAEWSGSRCSSLRSAGASHRTGHLADGVMSRDFQRKSPTPGGICSWVIGIRRCAFNRPALRRLRLTQTASLRMTAPPDRDPSRAGCGRVGDHCATDFNAKAGAGKPARAGALKALKTGHDRACCRQGVRDAQAQPRGAGSRYRADGAVSITPR
jgi:hypothetical protein